MVGKAYLVGAGPPALVVEPTFGEYARATRLAGGHVIAWRADPQRFAIDVAALCAAARRQGPRVVWLCTPNNPTGADLGDAGLAALVEACAAVDGFLVRPRLPRLRARGRSRQTSRSTTRPCRICCGSTR